MRCELQDESMMPQNYSSPSRNMYPTQSISRRLASSGGQTSTELVAAVAAIVRRNVFARLLRFLLVLRELLTFSQLGRPSSKVRYEELLPRKNLSLRDVHLVPSARKAVEGGTHKERSTMVDLVRVHRPDHHVGVAAVMVEKSGPLLPSVRAQQRRRRTFPYEKASIDASCVV